MSPSLVFWMDSLVGLIGGLVSLALLLLILASGLRQRLNWVFGLLVFFSALVGLSSAAADATLWISSRVLVSGEQFGNPMLWMELAATSFYWIAPAGLYFAITYIETAKGESPASSADQGIWEPHWYKVLAIIGLIIPLVLLPAILNHELVERVYLDQSDLRRWDLSWAGYGLSISAFIFELIALVLLWRNRQKLGEWKPMFAMALILVGGVVGGLVRVPFPIFNLSLAVSVFVLGYAVAQRQIFRPLRTMTQSLESTVAERTRELQLATTKLQRLNEQYRRVAEIGQEVARVASRQRQPQQAMAQRMVELIHNSLGYHHVYVYRPDETGRYLVAQAAAGSSAEAVLARAHRLQIGGRSLAGQAAAQHQRRVAEASGDDTVYFSDTALPGARSEIALPLLVSNRLLGVLDLQSINYGAFSEEDVSLLVNLADQFAAILDNARLLQETESALAEVEEIQRQYLRQAWESALGGPETASAYAYERDAGVSAADLDSVWSSDMAEAVQETQALLGETDETLALPIMLRGQIIGALQLRHKPGRAWGSEDVEIMSEISERLGVALETVRLTQESRRLAARERVIRHISDRMQRATNVQNLLRVATDELNRALSASRAYVRLGSEAELTADPLADGQSARTSD